MNCFYCDKIKERDPGYPAAPAVYDLGSAAPRCARHWRYRCGKCGAPAHFMAVSFCPEAEEFFCSTCASGQSEVESAFWAWKYYFRYQSPWSGLWVAALDRLEYEGLHPLQVAELQAKAQAAISQEEYLIRYPQRLGQWRSEQDFTDAEIQANWNQNADRWDAGYDQDGDPNRRYQSDEPMLALLGRVRGQRVLDVGCGNGYLCRKLARGSAEMTGVDLSDRFLEIAREREVQEPLGITYHHGSVADMGFLPDSHFDKAVSNYVLMDVRDFNGTLRHVYRLLRPGGRFVVVISHPCFSCGPGGWVIPALDSPRLEDRFAFRVDGYFQRGPVLTQWGDFDPVMSHHRPLRDYWEAFTQAGFIVDGFEEPSITQRGLRELPISSDKTLSRRLTQPQKSAISLDPDHPRCSICCILHKAMVYSFPASPETLPRRSPTMAHLPRNALQSNPPLTIQPYAPLPQPNLFPRSWFIQRMPRELSRVGRDTLGTEYAIRNTQH